MNLDNWESIAKAVGGIDENGQETSSSDKARAAIEILLGPENIKEAVRYYVLHKPGSELLRGVLWQLHPYSAMEECFNIFKTSPDVRSKRSAIELLRVVADRRVIPWITELLEYDDEGVQNLAIGIIDQLIFSHLCEEEEVRDLIDFSKRHLNPYVQENAHEIQSMITNSNDRDLIIQQYYASKNA